MSIVRVFFNPLDAKSMVSHDVEAGVQIIDFLQAVYPVGFKGNIRTFAGVEEILPDDLDYVIQDEEQITILVMPATVGAVVGYVIQALVAVAIGYVINLIFSPSIPDGMNGPEESPVYSLSPTRNVARLGQPIECHYGRVSAPPSFAAAPSVFNWYSTNDQLVDQLHCLGQGKYIINDVYVGEANIKDLAPGLIQVWFFDRDQHLEQFGRIATLVSAETRVSGIPLGFYEDVFSSPEVGEHIFTNTNNEPLSTWTAFSGSAIAAGIDPATGANLSGHITNVPVTMVEQNEPGLPTTFRTSITAGDLLMLQNTALNNIQFTVASVVPTSFDVDGNPSIVTLFQFPNDPNPIVTEDPLAGGAQYQLNNDVADPGSNMFAGPFRCQKQGTVINRSYVDIEFPGGLYYIDGSSGKIKYSDVHFTITWQQIDEDTGAAIGLPIVVETDVTENKKYPVRASFQSGDLTTGAYECSILRTTDYGDSSANQDEMVWTGLRGMVVNDDTIGATYTDCTMMAVRMKAGAGIGAAARARIRVDATRVLDDGPSNNCAVIVRDIWTNAKYGMGRDLSGLDTVQLSALQQIWTDNGPYFNGTWDTKGTGFQGLQNCVSLAAARVIQDGGLVTVIPDVTQPVRKALFSSANIVKDSLTIDYSFDTAESFDGIQIEYRDPATFQALYAYYNSDGSQDTPLNPDTYILFGCTDEYYALQYAAYLWNVRSLRRKAVTFQSELEALIPRFSDRIGVSSPMPNWGQSGVVVDVLDQFTLQLDQPLDWTASNIVILRDDLGTQLGPYSVTQGATTSIVVSGEALQAFGPEGRDPTNYLFGVADNIVRDFQVTSITPQGDQIIEIEAQLYDPLIYAPFSGGVCKEYECDAYENELGLEGVVTAMWPMNDPAGSTTVLDAISDNDLTVVGALDFERPSLIDGCGGDFSIKMGTGPNVQQSPATLVNTTSGSMGTVFNTNAENSGGGDMWIIWPSTGPEAGNFSSASFRVHALGGTYVRVTLEPSIGDYIYLDYIDVFDPKLPATQNIAVNYDLRENGDYIVELFVEYRSQGSRSGTAPSGEGWTYQGAAAVATSLIVGTGGLGDYQYSWYKDKPLNSTDIAALKSAWDQNQSGYTDPNPNCTEPV